eukprot:1156636-Pelagomonas_calceolata.AAC.25
MRGAQLALISSLTSGRGIHDCNGMTPPCRGQEIASSYPKHHCWCTPPSFALHASKLHGLENAYDHNQAHPQTHLMARLVLSAGQASPCWSAAAAPSCSRRAAGTTWAEPAGHHHISALCSCTMDL